MPPSKRQFDIVIYGATGFTGKLVAEYLASNSPTTLKLAIGGRSLSKLESVALELSQSFSRKVDIIVADSFNLQELNDMTSKTKVVISTVGPFSKYGELLVESCVSNSTHYIDSTGEPSFIRSIIDKYHDEAFQRNVKIVPSCGFDSLPSDLGSLLIANYFKSMGATTTSIEVAVWDVSGGISGGTIATMSHIIGSSTIAQLNEMGSNGNYLVPDAFTKHRVHAQTSLYYNEAFGKWISPFVMEGANLRYVRRSASLLNYGPEFQYSEGVLASFHED